MVNFVNLQVHFECLLYVPHLDLFIIGSGDEEVSLIENEHGV
jgi:hypothetical protein